MRDSLRFAALLVMCVACGHGEPAKTGAGSSAAATTPAPVGAAPGSAAPAAGSAAAGASDAPADNRKAPPAPVAGDPPPPAGHDFTATARALLVVGACGPGEPPAGIPVELVAKHCGVIKDAQKNYHDNWVVKARAFFAEHVPAHVPKRVVYPFSGGDLSTALTVYPDAEEITTMSLEPAGDPRTLEALTPVPTKAGKPGSSALLERALGTVQYELKFLYRVNFSNTLNMIEAMRGGALPTQLIFGLSAMLVHGYEVVSLRYFKLDDAGNVVYLTDDEVAKAPDPNKGRAEARNRLFANAEIRFRKPGGRVQIHRHIQVNLDNDHMTKDPRVLKHLEQKGEIAGMTKAASYLLSYEGFSTIRGYLLQHVQWMVSDATGVSPRWGKGAGFEYEYYGGFTGPHIPAGTGISKDWRDEFAAQPKRDLAFRFGYYDKRNVNHLVIMKRTK